MNKNYEIDRWQVHEWFLDIPRGGGWKYHLKYSGESLFKAFWIMLKLKRGGASCLKLEWRPRLYKMEWKV